MKWTLDQLRTFEVVAEIGSLTAAARRLDYTTGAVSQQIAALETIVGRPLLLRKPRGVELTDTGAILLPHVHRILAANDEATASLARQDRAGRVPIRLGIFGSIAVAAAGTVAAEIARAAPWIRLQALDIDLEIMPAQVLDGRLDIALALQYPDAPFPPQRGLETTQLASEDFLIVAPRAHPEVRTPAEIRDAANHLPWIIPPADTAFGRAVRIACAHAGIQPVEEHIVTDTAVSLALVEAGVGATLATPLMLELRATTAHRWPLPRPSQREIVALTRRAEDRRESLTIVLDAFTRAFRELSSLR